MEGASGTGVYNNTFKNNLFYQNNDLLGTQYSILSRYYESGWHTLVPIYQDISNNWFDNAGDPKFINITGAPDPSNGSQWDFHLQSSSPCIDNGAFLTTSASGSGTSFVVADAGYFMDGWGIIEGDFVQLQGQTQMAKITNVNYDTNVVTVDTPLTWTQGLGISLAYNGSAPDIGTYEYVETGIPIVTLNTPANSAFLNNQTVAFNCSASSANNLRNITLYGNWSGWHANQTVSIGGTSNSTTFIKTIPDGTYKWNCLAYDNSSNSGFAVSNYTFTIDTKPPLTITNCSVKRDMS